MKINVKKILIGALAYIAVDQTIMCQINRRRCNKNYRTVLEIEAAFDVRTEQYDKAVELANFYADKLNKHGVPVDEFDTIIMDNLTK